MQGTAVGTGDWKNSNSTLFVKKFAINREETDEYRVIPI